MSARARRRHGAQYPRLDLSHQKRSWPDCARYYSDLVPLPVTRALPHVVAAQVRPVPGDFSPTFEDRGHYIYWSATLAVDGHGSVDVELGYSRASGKADEAKEAANLRARVWQTMELARLGRADLLRYCLTTRHKRR
jgi:hypothetical protein